MTTILVGLGTRLRSDDALGLAAVQRWQARYGSQHPEITVELLECPGLDLLPLLKGHQRAILVDCVQAPAAAGVLHLDESDLAAFSGGSGSAHGWGVAETLALARSLPADSTPKDIRILGLPLRSIAPGLTLSEAADATLDAAVQAIEEEVLSEAIAVKLKH